MPVYVVRTYDQNGGNLAGWKNRIIGHGDEPLDAILYNPGNWRIHPRAQQEALTGILDQVGWVTDVIINQRTGHLVDGHLRCQVAARNGEKTIPVVYVDLSEDEEALILATIDPLSAMAATDRNKLDELLHAVKSDDERVRELVEGIAEREHIQFGEPPEDAEPQIDKAEELRVKWGVESGQMWKLGEHRLICGDCTDKAVVERVMGGEQINLVVVDPPYSVDYGAKNRALQTIGRSNRLEDDIEGDTLSTDETAESVWKPAFRNAYQSSANGAVIYCFSPQGGDMMMMMMMMKAEWNKRLHQLIWRKNSPTFSMGRLDYQYQHEPILYSWKGSNHGFYGDGGRSVLEFDRPSASKLHPTMKPVELVELLINNSSRKGEFVYDGFLGSGTTLIACERLGRRCRAVEISPAYCAVAIQRWVDVTGGTPELLN